MDASKVFDKTRYISFHSLATLHFITDEYTLHTTPFLLIFNYPEIVNGKLKEMLARVCDRGSKISPRVVPQRQLKCWLLQVFRSRVRISRERNFPENYGSKIMRHLVAKFLRWEKEYKSRRKDLHGIRIRHFVIRKHVEFRKPHKIINATSANITMVYIFRTRIHHASITLISWADILAREN